MADHADDAVTEWIRGVRSGDDESWNRIWRHFFDRICRVARARLPADGRRAADEEDVAQSALFALCAGVRADRFRRLEGRDDLWQILVMIASRKASKLRTKRKARGEVGESAVTPTAASVSSLDSWCDRLGDDRVIEDLDLTCDHLLAALDPKLRRVALMKLSGHSNAEIAREEGRTERSVERYLKMIRALWQK